MKEQVGVDGYFFAETADMKHLTILKSDYDRLKRLEEELKNIAECVNHEITPAKVESVQFEKTLVVMTIDCYKRLKRQDENVKREIQIAKVAIGVNQITKKYPEEDVRMYEHIFAVLESLDK